MARVLVAALLLASACAADAEPSVFAARVVAFEEGENAGYGQDRMPEVVFGPPHGGGESMGSLDVLSLGKGGAITLELGVAAIDGPGIDLVVFENPFRYGTELFLEPGEVSVSDDGVTFVAFACKDEAPFEGCAGLAPVRANPDENAIDPRDPAAAGGDGFDLADLGLPRAQFVRIRDIERGPDVFVGSGGFDLDAVVVVHD